MKTVEQQLDDMLPPDVQLKKRRAVARAKYFDGVAADLRRIGRMGPTVAEATANLKAALAAIRDDDIM